MGITNVIPEHMDSGLNYALSTYLKKVKTLSKLEIDKQTALKQKEVALYVKKKTKFKIISSF